MISKYWRIIVKPENSKDVISFRATGEFGKLEENEVKRLDDLKTIINPSYANKENLWEKVYLTMCDESNNEYDIPHLSYFFLKRKAYETLIKLKIHSEKIKHDFPDIVTYVISISL